MFARTPLLARRPLGVAASRLAPSARAYRVTALRAKEEHPGYVSASKQSPAAKAGYAVPGEANPSPNLYDRPPPAPSHLTPASELKHSSTAQEPAHPVLTEQAKTGELADRNPMPDEKTGEIGLDEAWRNRDAELKKK